MTQERFEELVKEMQREHYLMELADDDNEIEEHEKAALKAAETLYNESLGLTWENITAMMNAPEAWPYRPYTGIHKRR